MIEVYYQLVKINGDLVCQSKLLRKIVDLQGEDEYITCSLDPVLDFQEYWSKNKGR